MKVAEVPGFESKYSGTKNHLPEDPGAALFLNLNNKVDNCRDGC